MNKESVSRLILKSLNFKKSGSFLIGTCNADIIAGYSIDAPPGGLYIWRFILPMFDRTKFLHMALGKRIVFLPNDGKAPSKEHVAETIIEDWSFLAKMKTCSDLLDYLNTEDVDGDYAEWARYISNIRLGTFEAASDIQASFERDTQFPRVALVKKNLDLLMEIKAESGWEGAQALLAEWSGKSVSAFC